MGLRSIFPMRKGRFLLMSNRIAWDPFSVLTEMFYVLSFAFAPLPSG